MKERKENIGRKNSSERYNNNNNNIDQNKMMGCHSFDRNKVEKN